jgi:thiol-disulfide isomerase/thioredoxin
VIRSGIISLSLLSLLIGCAASLSSKKEVHNGIEMLYGKTSPQQLYFDFPQWENIEKEYQADKQVIEKLSALKGKFKVVIFFGTWCGDSKREVPHFYKIVKEAALNDNLNIDLWAVDRKKHLQNSLPQDNNIEYVPTFIFYKNGKEIGRIIESPDNTLEQDMLDILQGKNENK